MYPLKEKNPSKNTQHVSSDVSNWHLHNQDCLCIVRQDISFGLNQRLMSFAGIRPFCGTDIRARTRNFVTERGRRTGTRGGGIFEHHRNHQGWSFIMTRSSVGENTSLLKIEERIRFLEGHGFESGLSARVEKPRKRVTQSWDLRIPYPITGRCILKLAHSVCVHLDIEHICLVSKAFVKQFFR